MSDPRPGAAVPRLGRRAARGFLWQTASYGLSRVFFFVFTVLLARLLTPEEFGLVGLALLVVTYLEVVTDLGVAQGLVFLPRNRRRTETGVGLAVYSSVAMAAAVAVAAPALGSFFGRPDVTPLVRLLALSMVAGALAQVPDALLRKELRFERRLLAEVSRTLAQGVVAVVLAAAGLGAWAIAWGYLAGHLARGAVGWALVEDRPSLGCLRLDREEAGHLVRFGAPAGGAALLLGLVHDLDYLVVGRVLGATALGYYSVAFRVPQALVVTVYWAIGSVSFPVFSEVRDDPNRVRHGYLSWVRLQALYGFPAGVGLALVAPFLVDGVLGARWGPATAPLQALGIYAAVRALNASSFDVFKGLGRPGLALGLSAAACAVAVPTLVWSTRWGIAGVAWAQVGISAVFSVAVQAAATRLAGVRPSEILRALVPALTATAGTVAGAGAVRALSAVLPGGPLVHLAAAVTLGALGALVAVLVVVPGTVVELQHLLRRRAEPASRPGRTRAGPEFAALARLFLPASSTDAPVVEAPTWAPPVPGAAWGRLPRPSVDRPLRRLAEALARERAVTGAGEAVVHRLDPPAWTGSPLREGVRRWLLSGCVVTTPGDGPTVVEEVAAAAGVDVAGRPVRVTAGGGLIVMAEQDGRPVVLRVAPEGSPADPRREVGVLGALGDADVPCVPRVLRHGLLHGAGWALTTRLPGARPRSLNRRLVHELARFCAALPRGDRPPAAFGEDLAVITGGSPAVVAMDALERLHDVFGSLPGVRTHGDLWAGNLLTVEGRLSGVVDWGDSHPVGVPGVDLLQLAAGDWRLRTGGTLAGALVARPWLAPPYAEALAEFWIALGITLDELLLDAIEVAWWAQQTAVHHRRDPMAAGDPAWIEQHLEPVLERSQDPGRAIRSSAPGRL